MKVTLDWIEGARVTKTREGWEITRMALIEGLTGAKDVRLAQAADAPGLPAIGDRHPYAAQAYCERIEVEPQTSSAGIARVACIYQTANRDTLANVSAPANGAPTNVLSVQFFAQTQEELTTVDYLGRPMIVEYRGGGLEQGENGVAFLLASTNLVQASVRRPIFGVRIRHERAELPRELAPALIGTVNVAPWSGFPALTWLCTAFEADTAGGIVTSTFEALYNPLTWRVRHVFEAGGRVPAGVSAGNGVDVFDVHPPADWSRLGVTF